MYIYREEISNLAIISPVVWQDKKPLGEIFKDEWESQLNAHKGLNAIVEDDGTIIWKSEYTPAPISDDIKIRDLKRFLQETDNYALRIATGESKIEDKSTTYDCSFQEIMEKRKECRKKLEELESK